MKFKFLAVTLISTLLCACGGGSSDSTTTSGTTTPVVTTPTNPVSNSYSGFNYLQNLNANVGYTATYTDNGVGNAGSLTFGATSTTVSMTPQSDGGIIYGSSVSYGVAIGVNSKNSDLPAVAMICETVAGNGTGSYGKSTDVLVEQTATPITSAVALAGQSFSFYREDCLQGGTSPATTSGNSLSFDSNGNVTVTGDDPVTTVLPATISAATFTAALNGQPMFVSGLGSNTVFYAYSYLKQDGTKAYALIEHAAPITSNLTNGVLAIWSQQ